MKIQQDFEEYKTPNDPNAKVEEIKAEILNPEEERKVIN